MAGTRSVLDVLNRIGGARVQRLDVLDALGIDPGMPFDDFTRRLRYGKKADETIRWAAGRDYCGDDWTAGYDAALDDIKGGDA